MRRWLAIPALGVALIALPAWGQRGRGGMYGHGVSGGAGHSGFGSRGFMGGARGPMTANRGRGFAGFTGRPPSGRGFRPGFRPGFRGPFIRPAFHHGHHHHFFPGSIFAYSTVYGYPYYDPYFDGLDRSYDSSSGYYAQENEAVREQQAEIDRLSDEVARLREQREDRQAGPTGQAQKQSNDDPDPPTVLVFRDKHAQEVHNYAIVGQTVWVFSEQRVAKIPLAELDIPATKKANDERAWSFNYRGERSLILRNPGRAVPGSIAYNRTIA